MASQGRVRVLDGFDDTFGRYRRRLGNVSPIGGAIAQRMRRGVGSIEDQFNSTTELSLDGARRPWKRTRSWGKYQASGKTLRRTGALFRAWMGGTGSRQTVRKEAVAVGLHPKGIAFYGFIFQQERAMVRRVKRRRKTQKGRIRGTVTPGLLFGAFVKRQTVLEPRPVSVNPKMLEGVGEVVTRFIARGK